MRYIASFGAYAPPNSKLYFRAVGELAVAQILWRDFRQGRIFSRLPLTGELDALFAENANSILRKAQKASFRPHHNEKTQITTRAICVFWSKWRDSNSRPPVPEQIGSSILTTFICFLAFFSPKTVLLDALVRTVSAQSNSVDGQRCGHRPILT